MSSSSSMVVECASHSSATTIHSPLLNLPDELIYEILSKLPFWQMVNMSQTCSRLRNIALSYSKLWQELPDARVSELRIFEPFLDRSRGIGFDLDVSFIEIHELTVFCPWLDTCFARLRKLHIDIEDVRDGATRDNNAIALFQQTLSSPAPLLEDLCLAGSWKEPFLGSARPDILGGVMGAPKLRKLHLTLFSLDVLCPGLQGVTNLTISVGALAPKETAADNLRVHALFPEVQDIEIMGIELEGEIDVGSQWARPLARVPCIDEPLRSLKMFWYPDGEFEGEDLRAAAWLRESEKHVRNVELETVQWELVPEAVLSPFLEKARGLHIHSRTDPDGQLGISVSLYDQVTLRKSIMRVDEAHSLLKKFLQRAQRVSVDTLILSTDSLSIGLMKDVQSSLQALPRLRWLRLDIAWSSISSNGSFIAPETLASLRPITNIACVHFCAPFHLSGVNEASRRIDARLILYLLIRIFPNARSVIISIPLFRLPYYQLLFGYRGCAFRYIPMR